jgi:putative membrane protein
VLPRFLIHWLVLTVALAATAWLLPGVRFTSDLALLFAGLVLGFLNAVLKPVLVLLTLPLTVMTLGIFYFVLNAILFGLAATLVPGFQVAGFGSAFAGAIITSLVSLLLASLIGPRAR